MLYNEKCDLNWTSKNRGAWEELREPTTKKTKTKIWAFKQKFVMREKPERLPYKAPSIVPTQGRCELVSVFTFLFPLWVWFHPTSRTVLVLSGFKPLLTFMFSSGVVKYYLVKNNQQPKVTSRNWGDLREKKQIIPDRPSRSVVSRDSPVFCFVFLNLVDY